tara:strand:+ start:112 stop:300 length:189 start_codon:yes stop_codon:yes gene_type:complete
MFKQNYINIFENAGGNITLAYATCGDDALQMSEVEVVSLDKADLHTIGSVLKDLADSIEQEG